MIDLTRRLLKTFLDNMFIPEMAGGEDPVAVARYIKKAAVDFVRARMDAGIDLTASHFGRSTRWIYRLEEERDDEDGRASKRRRTASDSLKGNGGEEPATGREKPEKSSGIDVLLAALEFYAPGGREGGTAGDCGRALQRAGLPLAGLDLPALLDLYSRMGYLVRMAEQSGGREQVRYRAADEFLVRPTAKEFDERLKRLGARSQVIIPIARGYLRGDPGACFTRRFGVFVLADYLELVRRVEALFDEAIADALARSREKEGAGEGPLVRFESLLIMGTVPAGRSPEEEEEEEEAAGGIS